MAIPPELEHPIKTLRLAKEYGQNLPPKGAGMIYISLMKTIFNMRLLNTVLLSMDRKSLPEIHTI
jgi:hypothetical protein